MSITADSASPADEPAPSLIDADADRAPSRPGVMTILLLALPMFGQIFHYMRDIMPLWSLSKAFPILSLPLGLVLLRHPQAPMTRQVMLSFLWLLMVPAFNGIFSFNQDFFTGLSAEVKLLPMLYFFSFLGLLLLIRPTLREISSGFVICGVATYVALVLLWALIPDDWYTGTYGDNVSRLFTSDDRGHRIRMPMYFGIIGIFYALRRFTRSPRAASLFCALAGFGLVMGLVKTRAMLVGIIGVVALRALLGARGWWRLGMLVMIPIAIAALFSTGYLASVFRTDPASGFDLRLLTALKAIRFLGVDPARWVFGVGTISPTSPDSLAAYFDHSFFLGDITWLGIVFEFGVIGALLFVAYELRGIAFFFRALKPRLASDFLGALSDYLLYVLLISNLYPPSLTPGETAVILAIFAYVHLWLQSQDELEGSAG